MGKNPITKPRRQAVPYFKDSALLFRGLIDLPWAIFLDSGRPHSGQGRYDILAADPMVTLVTRGLQTEISDRQTSHLSTKDPFHLVRQALQPRVQDVSELPFCGGAIGYLSYDLARRLERLPECTVDLEHLPEMAIGIYDWALVVDHQAKRSWLVDQGRDELTRERWDSLIELFSEPGDPGVRPAFRVRGDVQSNMTQAQYAEGFNRIKHYIREGDCYQVNFAQRFTVPAEGDPWLAYQALRQSNPAPYAAYLSTPFAQVLSCSPESFLQVRGHEVVTKPIKGTCPRSDNLIEDQALAEALRNSGKNRAENLMIVDLLRNDLGKSSAKGSIHVPQM